MAFQESAKPAGDEFSESSGIYGAQTIWDDGETIWDDGDTVWDWQEGGISFVEDQKPATGGFQES